MKANQPTHLSLGPLECQSGRIHSLAGLVQRPCPMSTNKHANDGTVPGRRRVLTSSSHSSFNNNNNTPKTTPQTTPLGRPVRAKVDPSLFTSPGQTTAKVRAPHDALESAPLRQPASAPATPTIAATPAHARAHVTPSRAFAATLASPVLPQPRAASPATVSSPRKVLLASTSTTATAGAPSPKRVNRSPERPASRTHAARVPSPAPTATRSPTIAHLPPTVAVRTQSSPALLKRAPATAQPAPASRAPAAVARRTTDSLSPTPPPLSSSPGSVSASSSLHSPLTSPTLYAQKGSAVLDERDADAIESLVADADDDDDDRDSSRPSAVAVDQDTPTTRRPGRARTSSAGQTSTTGAALLPPLSLHASNTPRLVGRLSNSSVSSAGAEDMLASGTRPRSHHTRSHSMASTTSSIFSVSDREAMLSGLGSPPASWSFAQARPSQHSDLRGPARVSTESTEKQSGRTHVSDIQWSQDDNLDQQQTFNTEAAEVTLQPNEMEAIVANTLKREDQKQRKIDDLEITNKSLLTINTSLERLKLAQTREIRDLRRRLRDMSALGGAAVDGAHMGPAAALVAFRTAEGLPVSPRLADASSRFQSTEYPFPTENSLEDHDHDDDDDSDVEPTWDELLASDLQFSAIATVVESLVKRGREAVEWQVDRRLVEGAGRVLSAEEVEEKRRLEEMGEEDDSDGDSSR
ncbi:hypothetical protein ACM66B_001296 [Microbotryomycetes sp. NB124-2]